MSDAPLSPDPEMSPLPWFLQEPSTHPEVAPLALHVATVLEQHGVDIIDAGLLRIERWAATAPHIASGVGVWWHGRCVLLATQAGEV